MRALRPIIRAIRAVADQCISAAHSTMCSVAKRKRKNESERLSEMTNELIAEVSRAQGANAPLAKFSPALDGSCATVALFGAAHNTDLVPGHLKEDPSGFDEFVRQELMSKMPMK